MTPLPLLYAIALAASVVLWRVRAGLGISNGDALKICAEIMLCPVPAINVPKRLSFLQRRRLNALDIASHASRPQQTMSAMLENIRRG